VSAVTHLLYLHGFRSSPMSTKARRMAQVVQALRAQGQAITWCCPQLPPSPAQAVALLRQLIQGWPVEPMAVIGSSLGGFYATVLAEALGCRAVLINPAVEPARDLTQYIGEQASWHDPQATFFFRPEFVDELRALRPPVISQQARTFTLIATGDEVLDWREMHARYKGCPGVLVQGSDHALSDFDDHLPAVLHFLELPACPSLPPNV
jgi:uncharacterized protein